MSFLSLLFGNCVYLKRERFVAFVFHEITSETIIIVNCISLKTNKSSHMRLSFVLFCFLKS